MSEHRGNALQYPIAKNVVQRKVRQVNVTDVASTNRIWATRLEAIRDVCLVKIANYSRHEMTTADVAVAVDRDDRLACAA
jgi:hypothetical protein